MTPFEPLSRTAGTKLISCNRRVQETVDSEWIRIGTPLVHVALSDVVLSFFFGSHLAQERGVLSKRVHIFVSPGMRMEHRYLFVDRNQLSLCVAVGARNRINSPTYIVARIVQLREAVDRILRYRPYYRVRPRHQVKRRAFDNRERRSLQMPRRIFDAGRPNTDCVIARKRLAASVDKRCPVISLRVRSDQKHDIAVKFG